MAVPPHGQIWVCTEPPQLPPNPDTPEEWSCHHMLRLEPNRGGIRLQQAAEGAGGDAVRTLREQQAVATEIYTPLKEMEAEADRALADLAGMSSELTTDRKPVEVVGNPPRTLVKTREAFVGPEMPRKVETCMCGQGRAVARMRGR